MAHTQRLGALGIGVEAVAGTPVAPTHWLQPISAPTINDKKEYINIDSARGQIESTRGQILAKSYCDGDIEVNIDEVTAPIFFGLVLGTTNSASAGAGRYNHVSTVNNTNTAKTATITLDRVVDQRRFPNAVIDQLQIQVADGFATLKASFKAKLSATSSGSASYTTVTNYTFKDLVVKFGSTLAAATAASATPLSTVDLTIKRNSEMIHQSGSTDPTKIVYTGLEVNGSYSLLFEDTADRDKYLNMTDNAIVLEFTDGTSAIKVYLPKVNINNWEPSNDIDSPVSQTADFTAHYDATTAAQIYTSVNNTVASYTNL